MRITEAHLIHTHTHTHTCDQESADQVDAAYSNEADFDCDVSDNCGNWDYDHDDQTSVVEDLNCESSNFPSYHENNEPGAYLELDMDERLEKVDGFLFLSLGFTSKQNAWVGLDHWKHQKIKVSENDRPAEQPATVKQKKTKAQQDLDFTKIFGRRVLSNFCSSQKSKILTAPCKWSTLLTKLSPLRQDFQTGRCAAFERNSLEPCTRICSNVDPGTSIISALFRSAFRNAKSAWCRSSKFWVTFQVIAEQLISPHPCFICLLHLANEHGLMILGSPNLDDLSIHVT
ncbi:hypothetical protein ACFX1X_024455 [Malus domestica]